MYGTNTVGMALDPEREKAIDAIQSRPTTHVVGGKTVSLTGGASKNHVTVSTYAPYTETPLPYTREHGFVWVAPKTLEYASSTCGHGGVPVREEYSRQEEYVGILKELLGDGVTVVW